MIAQSCHIEKRRYTRGLYIQTRSNSGGIEKQNNLQTASNQSDNNDNNDNIEDQKVFEDNIEQGLVAASPVESLTSIPPTITSSEITQLNDSKLVKDHQFQSKKDPRKTNLQSSKQKVISVKGDGASKKGKAVAALLLLALSLIAFGIIFLFVPASIGLVAGILCLSFSFFALIAALTVAIV